MCTGHREYIRLQLIKYLIGPEPVMVLTSSLIFPIQTPAKSWSVSWLISFHNLPVSSNGYADRSREALKKFVRSKVDLSHRRQTRLGLRCNFLQGGNDFLSVLGNINLRKDLCHFPVLVDDECYTVGGQAGIFEDAVGLRNSLFFIAN